MDDAKPPRPNPVSVADPAIPDSKTAELFKLLALSSPETREQFKRMGNTLLAAPGGDLQAHFRLDCLTSADEDADAELA